MSEAFLDRLLHSAKVAGIEAEALLLENEETPVVFEANRLKTIMSRQSRGCALRIIANGRVGFAATYRLDDPGSLLAMALETAPFGAEARFTFPGAATWPQVDTYDDAVRRFATGEMIELGHRLIGRLREGHDDVLCDARISKSVVSVLLRNTNGCEVAYRKSVFAHSVEGTRIRGTDMLFVGDGEASSQPPSDPLRVAEAGRQQIEWCRVNAPAPSGQVPVLFTPDGVAGVLTMPITVGWSGKTVLQGASPVGQKLGERVFDERLSIWDDGTISYRLGSEPADDEGVATRRTALVEQGFVRSFYYDLQTAGLAGVESTGSAGRGLENLPNPTVHNLVVANGNRSFDELLADLHDGLVVEAVIGAGQSNVLGGEFGGNVILGYRVQNGRIVGRVKDTMISGNVYQALNDVVAVGSDARWVGGSIQTPSILIGHVGVSTAE